MLCYVVVSSVSAQWLETTVTVGARPGAFCWNPVENRTYVANFGENTVSVIRDSVTVAIAESGLRRAVPVALGGPAVLLDVSGRVVARSRSGEALPSGLGPGVYFLKRDWGSRAAKTVILR